MEEAKADPSCSSGRGRWVEGRRETRERDSLGGGTAGIAGDGGRGPEDGEGS